MILKNRPITRHYQMLQKITKRSERRVVWVSHNDVIEDFDFDKLAGSDEIAGNLDVRLGRRRFAAGMIMGDNDCCCTCHNC
jgi:hypothetical protein